MLRMLIVVGLCSCVKREVSITGPFVRDIKPVPYGLTVDSCTVEVHTETDYTWWWLGQSSSKEMNVRQGECVRQVVPTAGVP